VVSEGGVSLNAVSESGVSLKGVSESGFGFGFSAVFLSSKMSLLVVFKLNCFENRLQKIATQTYTHTHTLTHTHAHVSPLCQSPGSVSSPAIISTNCTNNLFSPPSSVRRS